MKERTESGSRRVVNRNDEKGRNGIFARETAERERERERERRGKHVPRFRVALVISVDWDRRASGQLDPHNKVRVSQTSKLRRRLQIPPGVAPGLGNLADRTGLY